MGFSLQCGCRVVSGSLGSLLHSKLYPERIPRGGVRSRQAVVGSGFEVSPHPEDCNE